MKKIINVILGGIGPIPSWLIYFTLIIIWVSIKPRYTFDGMFAVLVVLFFASIVFNLFKHRK